MAICLECNREKKSIVPHLKVHGMTKTDYTTKYGKDIDLGVIANPPKPYSKKTTKNPTAQIVDGMSSEERFQFDEQFEFICSQTSRDPVLLPMIRDICMNQIFIARYQLQIERKTSKFSDVSDAKIVGELHKLIQQMQETNLRNMSSLNMTAEKKAQLNKTPESTPSKVVAAFAFALKLMTVEEREKNEKDIAEAMRRLRKNRDELLTLLDENEEELAEDIEPLIVE